MNKTPIKFGLLAVIVLEIGSLFFMLHVYEDFVSASDNYYENTLVGQIEKEEQVIIDEAGETDN